ncbi:MAG TPA: tetratricopeptide repeat protein [Candidatus Paceibacterota bacterium]
MKNLNFIKQLYLRHPNYVALGIFALLVAIFYGNTLFNGFVLDDRLLIEQNRNLQSVERFPSLFGGCPTESTSDSCRLFYYRPLLHVWNFSLYQISPNPWIFHFGNLIVFLGTVLLVFSLVKVLTRKISLAFLTALLFLIYPRNTEVANWPSAIGELFLVFFVLLSLLLYMRWRETKSARDFLWVSVCYFLAMLAKEPALFVVPFLIITLNFLVFRISFKGIFGEIKRHAMLAVPLFAYGVVRFIALNGLGKPGIDPGLLGEFSLGERIYGSIVVLGEYIRSLVFPYPLLFFHDIQRSFDFFHPQFLLGLFAMVSLPLLLYMVKKREGGMLSFFLFWILLFYIPIFLLFQIVGKVGENVFAERYLFASNIAIAFFLSYGLMFLIARIKKRWVIVPLVGVLCVLSWAVVFPRNGAWHDNSSLFHATLAQTPNAFHVRELLADELRGKGDLEGAKREYEFIIAQGEGYRGLASAHNSLGSMYRDEEDFEKAQEHYEKALEISGGKDYRIYNNLGVLYVEQNQHLKALVNFCQALQINPNAPEPQQNFNRIASSVYAVEDSEFIFLYQDVVFGGAFTSEGKQAVTFKDKRCAYGSCSYQFIFQAPEGEILFPFLITATAFPQEVLRIQDAQFNPASQTITVPIDEKYKEKLLTFSFPACSGKRYEIEVAPL